MNGGADRCAVAHAGDDGALFLGFHGWTGRAPLVSGPRRAPPWSVRPGIHRRGTVELLPSECTRCRDNRRTSRFLAVSHLIISSRWSLPLLDKALFWSYQRRHHRWAGTATSSLQRWGDLVRPYRGLLGPRRWRLLHWWAAGHLDQLRRRDSKRVRSTSLYCDGPLSLPQDRAAGGNVAPKPQAQRPRLTRDSPSSWNQLTTSFIERPGNGFRSAGIARSS